MLNIDKNFLIFLSYRKERASQATDVDSIPGKGHLSLILTYTGLLFCLSMGGIREKYITNF